MVTTRATPTPICNGGRMKQILKLLTLSLVIAALPVAAATIPISNTGLFAPTTPDTNWTVNGATPFVTDDTGYPFPPWLANSGTSRWISPQVSYTGGQSDAPGTYNYVTTFDLTGLDPGTAVIDFIVAVDNLLTNVLINGNPTGITYASLTPFSGTNTISTNFIAGVNTLEFQTTNTPFGGGNPSGLRVEFTSATADAIVPEPTSFALFGMGVALLAIRRFRQKH